MTCRLPTRIAERITDFTGRRWLLPALLEWLDNSGDRLFIIQGEPGTGKSMIAAWLAGAGPLPRDGDAKTQLQQIRSQVKAGHFCVEASGSIAPKAFAQSIAEQLTKNVPGFGDALATTLADQVKIMGEVNAGRIDARGSATGVYIERLELAGLSDELSFDRALRAPLKALYGSGHDEPMVLLLDALDEAETYTGSPTIVRLLARLTDLPDKIRVLVTTRPDPRVLKHYRGVKPFDLIGHPLAEEDDLRLYVFEQLPQLDNAQRNRLTDGITKSAAGNFLYAQLALDDVLSRLPEIPHLDEISSPKGLSGFYHDFLNRELGQDEERWYTDFKPMLGLISVARGEGLNRTQIENMMGKEVEASLRICKQYLVGELPEGPFRPFHRSFAEFLLEDAENIDYPIDAPSIHRRIADYYLVRFSDEWSQCDVYGLRHLPAHLLGSGRLAELKELTSDFNWLSARLDATDMDAVISDYDLLPKDPELRLVQGALRLSAHVLAEDGTQLPGQLWGRLLFDESPTILKTLDDARRSTDTPWLRPLTPSLEPPGGPLVRTLTGHSDVIKSIAVTENGRTAISASHDQQLIVWDLAKGTRLRTLPGHTDMVTTMAATPDGKRAISGSSDCTLRVWDPSTGEQLHVLKGHTRAVSAVSISADGGWAVSGSGDHSVRVWDLKRGEQVQAIEYGEEITSIAITSSGDQAVVACGWLGALKLWDLRSAKVVHDLQGHDLKIVHVALTSEDEILISVSEDLTVIVWDLKRGLQLGKSELNRLIAAVAVTPGVELAVAAVEDSLELWSLETGECLRTLTDHTDLISAVEVRLAEAMAIAGLYDGTLKVWDLATGDHAAPVGKHAGAVTSIVVTQEGSRAISTSDDHTAKVWDLHRGQELYTLRGRISPATSYVFPVNAVALTPDERLIVVASWHWIKVHDFQDGEEVFTLEGQSDRINTIAVTPDGRYVISGSEDHRLNVWDLASGRHRFCLEGHTSHIVSIATTQDSRYLLSTAGEVFSGSSPDNTIIVWDLRDGKRVRTLKGHSEPMVSLAVTPDGLLAVSASSHVREGSVTVWSLENGTSLFSLKGRSAPVAIIPEGRWAVSVGEDHALEVWDLDSGERRGTLVGHTNTVETVSVSADSGRVVSSSEDRTVRVWDLQSGTLMATYTGESPIRACDVTRDGTTIVAGEASGRVHFLRLEGA